jgi:hypothetical protein
MKVFLSYGHDFNVPLIERIRSDLEAAGTRPGLTVPKSRLVLIGGAASWRVSRRVTGSLPSSQSTPLATRRHGVQPMRAQRAVGSMEWLAEQNRGEESTCRRRSLASIKTRVTSGNAALISRSIRERVHARPRLSLRPAGLTRGSNRGRRAPARWVQIASSRWARLVMTAPKIDFQLPRVGCSRRRRRWTHCGLVHRLEFLSDLRNLFWFDLAIFVSPAGAM